MRKRSDVNAAARTAPMFDEQPSANEAPREAKPAAQPEQGNTGEVLPPRVSVQGPLVFVECPKCGLKSSTGKLTDYSWTCLGCSTPVDPDYSARRLLERRNQTAPAPAPATAAVPAPAPPPAAKPAPTTLEREDIGALANQLKAVGFDVPLTEIATWEPSERREALEFALSGGAASLMPKRLAQKVRAAVADAKQVVAESRAAVAEVASHHPPPVVNIQHAEPRGSDTVTVTWGEQRFSPVAYNTFGVGPFSMTTAVRHGETHAAAMERAMGELRAYAERQRDAAFGDFVKALRGFEQKTGR